MPDPAQQTATEAERAELEQLSARLATRQSITHLAVGFVGSFIGVVAAGITVKLGFDRNYLFSAASGVLALACLGVAVRGFFKGQKLKNQEHVEYRRLLDLRAKAGLD